MDREEHKRQNPARWAVELCRTSRKKRHGAERVPKELFSVRKASCFERKEIRFLNGVWYRLSSLIIKF